MLDFFREMMEDAPVCTMVPLGASEDPPEGWLVMDGSTWDPEVYPEFDKILSVKRSGHELINKWWEDNGGHENTLPTISSDEAYAASFGVEPGKEALKMIIKVKNAQTG